MTKKERRIDEQGEETLQCNKCKEWKPLSEFSPHGKNKDGSICYHSECKECRSGERREETIKQGKKPRKRERQVNEQGQELLYCTCCKEWKVSDDFSVSGKNKDVMTLYFSWCKGCYNQKAKNRNAKKEKKERSSRRERSINEQGYEVLCCSDCNTWKISDDFYVVAENKNGLKRYSNSCRKCSKARLEKWNEAHPENKRVKAKIHYHENKDEINATRREDRKLNPEKWKIKDLAHSHARRGYGSELLNVSSSIDDVFHHLGTDSYGNHDSDTGVYIPKKVHVYGEVHCIYSETGEYMHGQGMVNKNWQIYEYYKETHPKDIKTIEYILAVCIATEERWSDGWENAKGWDEWLAYKQTLDNQAKADNQATIDQWIETE